METNVTEIRQEILTGHNNFGDGVLRVLTIPYFRLYEERSRDPLLAICRGQDQEDKRRHSRTFLEAKRKEAKYVQVAGALMFSSAIAGISWTNLKDDHWLAAASWECSIVCALFAIITGAQHMLILDDHLHPDDPEKLQVFEHYLVSTENRPHWGRLLCWQGPMLLQTYSVVLFLVGLGAHVISPVVAKKAWDDDAKRLALFSICAFLVVVAFGVFSQGTHNTFKSRDRV